MKRIHAALAILVLSLSASAGCANNNYSTAQITQIEGSDDAVIDFRNGVTVPEGVAVSANIQLIAFDGNSLSGNLQSENPSILVVTQSASNSNDYVFLGVSAGKTTISVTTGGNQVATVQATVTPPPTTAAEAPTAKAGTTIGPDADVLYGVDAGADATADATLVDASNPVKDAGAPPDAVTASDGAHDAGDTKDAHGE